MIYPLASEGSREEANLTERKNPHTPKYGVKEFVRLFLPVEHRSYNEFSNLCIMNPFHRS